MLQEMENKTQKDLLKITIFFQRHKYQDLTLYACVTTNFKSSHSHHVRINNGRELKGEFPYKVSRKPFKQLKNHCGRASLRQHTKMNEQI